MRSLQGFNVGGDAAGPVFSDEDDDTCPYVNEDGVKCIRPRGHTEGLHRFPEMKEENDGD
jgi:hypothetical protein